jgi:hypothetical protein
MQVSLSWKQMVTHLTEAFPGICETKMSIMVLLCPLSHLNLVNKLTYYFYISHLMPRLARQYDR